MVQTDRRNESEEFRSKNKHN